MPTVDCRRRKEIKRKCCHKISKIVRIHGRLSADIMDIITCVGKAQETEFLRSRSEPGRNCKNNKKFAKSLLFRNIPKSLLSSKRKQNVAV